MDRRTLLGLVFLLITALVSSCGGGGGDGGGGVDPNALGTITMASSRSVVLANGIDAVTIRATVRKNDGSLAPDNTAVAFTAANSGVLSAPGAATTNGIASVTLTRAPITGASVNGPVIVTAAAGNITGHMTVMFINLPSSVDVSIAFGQDITNLAKLQFTLLNTAGTVTFANLPNTQAIAALNSAVSSTVTATFDQANQNKTAISLSRATGFHTGTLPIIKATFNVVPVLVSLPSFSVDISDPFAFLATDAAGNDTVPQAFPQYMTVTTKFNTEP